MPRRFELVGDSMPKWEPASRLRALRPSVTHGWVTQAKMRKKCCYARGRTWVNIAVRLCLHSFITHNKHHLLENKVWEIYIFIKKCIRSLLKSLLSVDYVPACICIRVVLRLYNNCYSSTRIALRLNNPQRLICN